MGVLVEGNIFGPRVKFSKGIINTKEGFKYFPDYIDSTINGVFTDKAGVEPGMNIDIARGIILDSSYKGTVRIKRESNTGQPSLYTKKLFGDIDLINESGGFDAAVFQLNDIKYLYEHGDLPLTDDSRLFLRLGDLEYRISTVRKKLNVYDKDGNDVGDYSPELSVCYNGKIIQSNKIYGFYSSIYSGGSYRAMGLAGSDIAMIVLRIKNIDPTVVLQSKYSYGSQNYCATLNGYVNTSGEKSQSPKSIIYIPVFVQANTYTNTKNTKFLIQGSGSNWYVANSNIKIKPIQQLIEKMKNENSTSLFDAYGYIGQPLTKTTLSDFYSDAAPYISDPINFQPQGGVHFAWTYNPVNNIDTDDIIYNSLNARPSDPPAPEPGGDTPADDPDTDYTQDESDGEQDFPFSPGTVIGGDPTGEAVNAYRPSYSNYIFERFYKANDSDNNNAITFIQDAANPSAFELWGTTFKLLTGHPTPGEIISRVYMLPFEYDEIRGTDSAGYAYSAPVYGPIGPVTLGAKNYSENPSQTGAPELDHVHYYLQILNRFKIIDLGTVTIERVFNNYLDYTETKYTLNLPYAAGKIELDPDYLFMNGRISGTVKLIGCIDFDTGELSITVQLNNQLYYQTTVNIAVDRLATVNDNLATPLAISKAVMASAATAGGLSKMLTNKQSDRSKEYEEMRTAEIIKRQQNETAEIAKRTSIQEEASMRVLKARKEGGL